MTQPMPRNTVVLVLFLTIAFNAAAELKFGHWTQYDANPFTISLDIPPPEDSAGGLIVADADGDGRLDYLVTVPGYVACYGHDGAKLWVHKTDVGVGGSSESHGLPGHHGPGVTAADIDGDRDTEVLYLTKDNTLHVVDGATGAEKWSVALSAPEGAERWEHLVIANLRGKGDRDLILQATNKDGYRVGHYVAAYELRQLRRGRLDPLWRCDNFLSCAHNGIRIADLDGDGRD